LNTLIGSDKLIRPVDPAPAQVDAATSTVVAGAVASGMAAAGSAAAGVVTAGAPSAGAVAGLSAETVTDGAAPVVKPVRAKPKPRYRRLIQLDVLRGVAILLVLGCHFVISPRRAGILRVPATMWARLGGSGVDLFFVLSGFLVGGLLFSEMKASGALDVKRFLIRRAFKIWPSYYLFLIAALAIYWVEGRGTLAGLSLRILPGVFHLQNYLGSPFPHTWSLAVEEHFYLALPILLLTLLAIANRRAEAKLPKTAPTEASPAETPDDPEIAAASIKPADANKPSAKAAGALNAIPVVAVSVMAFCLLYRCLVNWRLPYSFLTHQWPTHIRVDALFFGVLLAYLHHYRPAMMSRIAAYRKLLLIAGAALLAPMAIYPLGEVAWVATIGYTCLYLGYGCILVALIYTSDCPGRMDRLMNSPPAQLIALVGTFSYGIYLWHLQFITQPLVSIVDSRIDSIHLRPEISWALITGFYITAAILLGMIASTLVEKPALALREKMFPSR
jgi:peptidoglycan/LPS O-acetylase OafA/YrhL